MKRILEIVGIITLLIGSFMYKEEVLMTSKLSDNLLEEIKNKCDKYKIKPIDAIVRDDTIIPGINGREINILESYEKMKEIGYFNDKLIVYNDLVVSNPLKINKDKYIVSGNKSKKEVALIFIVNKDIYKIVKILNKENAKATFFIDSDYLENNHNYVIKLLKEGHTIGNLSRNNDYSDSDFIWMKTIFINSGYQKNNYCFVSKKDKKVIDICNISDSYTILADVLKNPFTYIRGNLTNGGIYVLSFNNKYFEEVQSIIKYIKARGYEIKSLEELLKE